MKVLKAVEAERDRLRTENEMELNQKLTSLRCEMEKQINLLMGELATEKDLVQSQLKQISSIKMVRENFV